MAPGSRRLCPRTSNDAEQLRRVGTVASGIAHDFENLLMVISEQIGFAQTDLPGTHPARASLEVVEKAITQARCLTNSLRSYVKGVARERTMLNLSDILATSIRFLRRTLPESIEFVGDVQTDPPIWVEGDAVQLERVVSNLIANARLAMPNGGRLAVSLRNRVDRTSSMTLEGTIASPTEAVLRICDTGVGMSAATLARIFEPFFTTKPCGRGTGLGMSIVQDIVASHGGRIEVESEPGHGTEVCITIPCIQLEGPEEEAPLLDERSPLETVLVVSADDGERSALAAGLVDAGFDVACAPSGIEALGILNRQDHSIRSYVLDLDSVKGNDLIFIQTLRRERALSGGVVLVGSSSVPADAVGEEVVLRKPARPRNIAVRLADLLAENPAPCMS